MSVPTSAGRWLRDDHGVLYVADVAPGARTYAVGRFGYDVRDDGLWRGPVFTSQDIERERDDREAVEARVRELEERLSAYEEPER